MKKIILITIIAIMFVFVLNGVSKTNEASPIMPSLIEKQADERYTQQKSFKNSISTLMLFGAGLFGILIIRGTKR